MIDDNMLIVAVLTILGSLYGFYVKIKRQIIDDEETKNKPINDLNNSIIELNSTIKYMNEDYKSLSSRVEKHGKQIDELNLKVEKIDTKVQMYHHE